VALDPGATRTEMIADTLRTEIREGLYADRGGRLPSEQDLADRFDVHRGTVRRGLGILVAEGLLIASIGKGYFVRRFEPLDWWPGTFEHADHRGDQPGVGYDAWAAEVQRLGRGMPRQDVDVSKVIPPARIAGYLATPDGEAVIVRRRLRWVDHYPVHTADSYYPLWVAEGTQIMLPGDITIPGGLMAAAGHPQRWFDDTIDTRMPTPEEAFRLDLAPGTPVAVHWRVGEDAEGRPVRCIVSVLPGDRNRIRMRFPAAAN